MQEITFFLILIRIKVCRQLKDYNCYRTINPKSDSLIINEIKKEHKIIGFETTYHSFQYNRLFRKPNISKWPVCGSSNFCPFHLFPYTLI